MKGPQYIGCVELSSVPEPRKWFFRGTKRKRDVTVKLFVCPGFTHTYADIEESKDALWDPSAKEWRYPTHNFEKDTEEDERQINISAGRRYHQRFEKALTAEKWVVSETKKNFPRETHRLVDWRYPHGPWKPKLIGKPRPEPTRCTKCRMFIKDRGKNISHDWTGGPYCDVCILRSPDYGDGTGLKDWRKITARTAKKWT